MSIQMLTHKQSTQVSKCLVYIRGGIKIGLMHTVGHNRLLIFLRSVLNSVEFQRSPEARILIQHHEVIELHVHVSRFAHFAHIHVT